MKAGLFSSLSVSLVLLLSFLFVCPCPVASAAIRYTIKKGDTLSAIAQKYKVSVGAIKRSNKVNATRLRPGSKIIIPVRKETSVKTAEKVAKAEGSAPAKTSSPGIYRNDDLKSVRQTASDLYHTVKKGDTLSSIAHKYAVTITDLKELNGLRTSKVKTGEKLLIRSAGPRTYIVRKGDNLRKIARRFNIDPDDLMEINEMEKPVVRSGQKLYLQETVDNPSSEEYAGTAEEDTDNNTGGVSEPKEAAGEPAQDRLIAFASKLLNIPYKFGGSSILGIDCSAYVRKVYGFLGIDLPRTAREQFNSGEPIDRDQLSVGDLVFFRTYASFPSHVGIYIGNNLFIHASSKGRRVTISSLDTPYFLKRFIGAKRLLTGNFLDGLPGGADSGTPDEGVH